MNEGRKRPREVAEASAAGQEPVVVHYRLLVPLARAGPVIGKGGEFVKTIRESTGAKLLIDKAVEGCDVRIAHMSAADVPGAAVCPAQNALFQTFDRLVREGDGNVAPTSDVRVSLLVFRHQIGAVIGAKGSSINAIRQQSGSVVKVLSPRSPLDATHIPSCALPGDELLILSGTYEGVRKALTLVSERIRAAQPPPPAQAGAGGQPGQPKLLAPALRQGLQAGGAPGARFSASPLPLPPRGSSGSGAAPFGGPPAGGGGGPSRWPALLAPLPPQLARVLDNNSSVDMSGLTGNVSVEYRILVAHRRSGVIIGTRGAEIREMRIRSGARVLMHDALDNCPERVLQIVSTEDVQEPMCGAMDAALHALNNLAFDDTHAQTARLRLLLAKGQPGAVMGVGGSTIRALRTAAGCDIDFLPRSETPACGQPEDEVVQLSGSPEAVMIAARVLLVTIRGHMARSQLRFNHPPPENAPPPTQHPQRMPAVPGPAPPPGPGPSPPPQAYAPSMLERAASAGYGAAMAAAAPQHAAYGAYAGYGAAPPLPPQAAAGGYGAAAAASAYPNPAAPNPYANAAASYAATVASGGYPASAATAYSAQQMAPYAAAPQPVVAAAQQAYNGGGMSSYYGATQQPATAHQAYGAAAAAPYASFYQGYGYDAATAAGGGTMGAAALGGQPGAGAGGQQRVSVKIMLSRDMVQQVAGDDGSKLEYAKQLTGAGIRLLPLTSVGGERELEVSGSMAQVSAAQNLIHVLVTAHSTGGL